MNEETINKYKKYLTKAQVRSLADLSNRYKQTHAANRAEAYNTLYGDYMGLRRNLQNRGLASRRGNIISGREKMGEMELRDQYKDYSDKLGRAEDAMTEAAAARMAAQNQRAQQQQQMNIIEHMRQAAWNGMATQNNVQYGVQNALYNTVHESLKQKYPKTSTLKQPTATGRGAVLQPTDNFTQYEEKQRVPVKPQTVYPQEGAIGAAAAKAGNNGTNSELIQNATAQAYNAMISDLMKVQGMETATQFAYNTGTIKGFYELKQKNPMLAKKVNDELAAAYNTQQTNSAAWDSTIAKWNGGEVKTRNDYELKRDADRARKEKAEAESAINRAYLSMQYPEYAGYLIMNDSEFAASYDVAEQLYKQQMKEVDRLRSASKFANTDRGSNASVKAEYAKRADENEKRATEAFAPFERSKTLRAFSSAEWNMLNGYDADEKNNVAAPEWLTTSQEKNWEYAVSDKWSASDYKNSHDITSKTAPLVNEWSVINGDTTSEQAAEGALNRYVEHEQGGTKTYSHNKFIEKCAKEYFGTNKVSLAQREQMKIMLELAYFMTDEERARYNTILASGNKDDADKYFDFLYNNILPERADMAIAEKNDKLLGRKTLYDENGKRIGSEGGYWGLDLAVSAVSVPTNLLQGAVGPAVSTFTNQKDTVAAKYGARRWNTAQEMRGSVSENYGDWGKFFYETGMSMADSAAVGLISGGLGSMFASLGVPTAAVIGGKTVNVAQKAGALLGGSILGGSAYNSSYQEALERGLSPEKARLTAVGNGVNEMLFESLSLDKLVGHFQVGGELKVSKSKMVNLFVNSLVQAGVEGSEELFTDMANEWWDNTINDIYAEELTKMRDYVANGMSFEEAKQKVAEEFNEQLGMSFLGGAVSGGVMGGGASFLGMIRNGDLARYGNQMSDEQKARAKNFEFKNEEMAELASANKLTNADYAMLDIAKRQEEVGNSLDVVNKAQQEGRITQEVADIYKRYAENGFQSKDNPNGITMNEFAQMMDSVDVVGFALEVANGIKGEYTALEEARVADQQRHEAFVNQNPMNVESRIAKAAESANAPAAPTNTLEGLRQQRERSALARHELTETERREGAQRLAEQAEAKNSDLILDGNTVVTGKGSGKVTFDFSKRANGENVNHNTLESMTETERATLRLARMVAASTRSNIKIESEFTGRHKKENGYYNPLTKTLHINLSGEHSAVWVMSHELTHHLQTMNERAYNDLRDAIKKALSKEDVELSDLDLDYDRDMLGNYLTGDRNLWQALNALEEDRYDEEYKGKDRAERVEEEVVARCCESFLRDSKFVRQMAEQHYRSAREITRFLKQFAKDVSTVQIDAAVRAYEGGYDTNDISPENNMLRDFADIEKIADLWARGLREIADKRAKAKKATGEIKEKYSLVGVSNDGRFIMKSNYPKGTPKAVKSARIIDLVQNVWSKKPIALTIWNTDGSTRNITARFDPSMPTSSSEVTDLTKIAGGNRIGTASEQRITLNLGDDFYFLAQTASYSRSKDAIAKPYNSAHEGVKRYHYFVNDILYEEYESSDRVPIRMNIDVKEREDGEFFYSFHVDKTEDIKKIAPQTLHAVVKGETLNDLYKNSISDKDTVVKSSIMDSKGKNLSMKQIEYFDKSKVRDKEGRLRPVYHYTNESFTEFRPMDASKGSRRTHGDGYYVSTNATEFADFGKNKMVMYANITNPFEMTMTEEEANKVYDKYAAKFHTTDKFGTYREHAVGALQSSYKVMDYLSEYAEQNGIQISDILKDLGYDGVHDGSEWVAYDSNQLKNVDNLNPTTDKDTRFSIMDKDFRMEQKKPGSIVRTFKQNETTANVIGSSVELEGGSLLNRVRMMQNLAEEYGSVTVTATSEKEAQAFERAGAKRETDAFSEAEYGTWEFTHTENKYQKDTVYDAKQKRNFADAVLKEVGTRKNFTQDDLRVFKAKLEKAFAVLHNATFGKGDQLAAWEYADKLFDSILNRYSEMSEADADMRDAILAEMPRKTDGKGRIFHEIEVTEGQMAEIKHAFGSVAAYNQALSKALGTRVYVKQTENAKTLEDVFASDSRFDATTNEGDMPGVLLKMAEDTIAKRTNPLRAESQERAAAKESMFAKAMSIVGVEQTTAQKVREAVKEARAEERAKAKDKTAKAVSEARLAERMHEGAIRAQERRAFAEREANIKRTAANREAKLKEITQQKLEQQKTEQLRRDVKKVALKWNQRLVKMLANPTEASHIPVQLAKEVAEFTKTLTEYLDRGTERGQLNLTKIMKAYQQAFDDQATIAEAQKENPKYDPRGQVIDKEMYDEQLVAMMNELNKVIEGKSFKDLSAYEMRMLLNTVRGVCHTVYEANRMIGTEERKAIWKVGSQMVNQLEATHVSNKMRGYLETSLDLRRIAKIFSNSDENAEFVKLVDQLNKGAIEKERVAQVLQDMFKPVTDQYGDEISKWYGKKAEWIDTGIEKNGKKVEITKGMRVSLALHVLNEGNMKHIENGGLTIPSRELYNKGKLQEAYADKSGRLIVQLSKEQINEIISHMTDAEKAYVAVASEFFHKRTGYFINKTSLQVLGYRKAIVENYFPIHTNKNYTYNDWTKAIMENAGVENQGFLNERKDASNPIYLEDITSVVNRQIDGVALYSALAAPLRNWKAVMNTQVWNEQGGVWQRRTSVKETIIDKMGSYGDKVLQDFITDVSEMSHVDVTPMERFAGKLATNYVKAVLLGNLKVAMKQVASYPTAAAVIPWKYLAKALVAGGRNNRVISRANVDLINQYTPLYQMRRAGQANEIASIMQRRGLEEKMPWLLGWITKMDVMTVGRLWSAAEYMVADQQKNLVKGSDAYYKAVAQVFNDTVQQTQPNFTPLQRNAALRSKNPIVRSLVLFGTQRMQNGGIMLEAAYELKQSKGKSPAEIKAAKMKLGRAVASQIIQNILLIAASLGVDALRGRMKSWQDEDKDITMESLAKGMGDTFLSNAMGSFLGGSEVYSLLSGFYKKATDQTAYDTEFTVPALDAAETLINFAQSDIPNLIKYLTGDHTDEEKMKKAKTFSFALAKAFGYATGIPLENVLKDLFKGIIPAIEDHKKWLQTGEFTPWLHQSGKLDNATTARNYNEWTKAGKKGSTYLYWENQYKSIKEDDELPNGKTLSEKLMASADLSADEKAMLYRMLYRNDTTNEGTIVYNAVTETQIREAKKNNQPIPTHGTIAIDFRSNASYIATTNLSDAQYEGYQKMVADGIPEDLAYVSYRQYSVQNKEGAGANDRFHEWLFTTENDPHQRAVIDMYIVGNTNSVNGSIGYKDGEVWRDYSTPEWYALSETLSKKSKAYTYAKKLTNAGLSAEKAIQIVNQLKSVNKKADAEKYIKGLTEAQKKLIYEWKGWKYGK